MTRADPASVDRLLAEHWPDAACELQAADPWQLLVAVILSARTSDVRVNQVMAVLNEHYVGPQACADLDPRELENIIRKVPLFRQKARSICEAARAVVYSHGGAVPDTAEALMGLAGVGRKTAAVVLGNAFDQPAVAADVHVQRVVRRFGWTLGVDANEAESAVSESLPEDRWVQACHQMIRLGREHCRPVKPFCSRCPLADVCPKIDVDEHR